MLTFTDTSRECVSVIPGKAHIVLSFDEAGSTCLKAFFNGQHDSSYGQLSDERTMRELDKLVRELREQLQSLPELASPQQAVQEGRHVA